MARRLSALLVILALAGCDLGGGKTEREVATSSESTSTSLVSTLEEPRPSLTELVVQAIRSCEVKRIVFLRGDNTWITYRGGETVHTKGLATKDLERAAWKHAAACNLVIGME